MYIDDYLLLEPYGQYAQSLITQFEDKLKLLGLHNTDKFDRYLATPRSPLAVISFILNCQGEPRDVISSMKRANLNACQTYEEDLTLNSVCQIINNLPFVEDIHKKVLVDYFDCWYKQDSSCDYRCEILFKMLSFKFPLPNNASVFVKPKNRYGILDRGIIHKNLNTGSVENTNGLDLTNAMYQLTGTQTEALEVVLFEPIQLTYNTNEEILNKIPLLTEFDNIRTVVDIALAWTHTDNYYVNLNFFKLSLAMGMRADPSKPITDSEDLKIQYFKVTKPFLDNPLLASFYYPLQVEKIKNLSDVIPNSSIFEGGN